MSENDWSDWLDFHEDEFSVIPESPGVFMMHAAMKILFIGGSTNLKQSIENTSSGGCASKAKRFRYREEENFEKIKEELISDFKKRHEGNLPGCMD